jgi:DNA end-binding protein Ku
MAQSFIDALAGEFRPEDFTDAYREALEAVVRAKADGIPLAEEPEAPQEAEVVDLVAALRASVEAAKKRRAAAEQAKAM